MANLFGKNRLREQAQQVKTEDIQDFIALIKTWHKDYHSGSLKTDKETSREQAYNQDFFIKILGYREKPANPFSFEPKAIKGLVVEIPVCEAVMLGKNNAFDCL